MSFIILHRRLCHHFCLNNLFFISSSWNNYLFRPNDTFIFFKSSVEDMFIDVRERREREKEREKQMWGRNIDQLPLAGSLTGYWTCSLGMCPDQGLNPQLFGAQNNAPTQPSGRSWMTPFKRRLSASSQHTVKFEVFICDPWILYTALAVTITVCCGL